MRILGSVAAAALLSCIHPSVARAGDLPLDDFRLQAVWLGPTFSLPLGSPHRSEWGGEVAFLYGPPRSRTGLGFDLGASNERAYVDAVLGGTFSERTGWFVNAGPVLGYGTVDGPGGRVGVSAWVAPFFLPLVLSVNAIDTPHSPLMYLGTFSVKLGGGF